MDAFPGVMVPSRGIGGLQGYARTTNTLSSDSASSLCGFYLKMIDTHGDGWSGGKWELFMDEVFTDMVQGPFSLIDAREGNSLQFCLRYSSTFYWKHTFSTDDAYGWENAWQLMNDGNSEEERCLLEKEKKHEKEEVT